MGQRFQIIAPRAHVALTTQAKLGEVLFDESFSSQLVYLLAIPVRPPLLSANDSAVQRTTVDTVENMRDAAGHGKKRKADDEILVPVDAPSSKQAKTSDAVRALHRRTTTAFCDFPGEIHRLIFAQFEDVLDIVNLGATSQYFWAIAREFLEDFAISFVGQWAGEKIVFVGENVEQDDYPPGLFTAEERDDLRLQKGPAAMDDWDRDYSTEPFTLYHFSHPSVCETEDSETEPSSALTQLIVELSRRYPEKEDTYPCTVLTGLYRMMMRRNPYFPQDQPWILRNLTTKQFVRSEAIALKPEFIHGPFIRGLGFAQVVMSRICWSSSNFVSIEDPTNISRGVWAGHCFDITTRTRHEEQTKGGQGWEDASDQVAEEIASIWESNLGPDWREEVCEDASRYRLS
ncbi:hypothetical protein THARTR1_05228 [Trichoderma harzianum]|uniref:F-box domain-containing protein n=1 Tax=Trichoderma harzianum TaxID=5544 RepID=A0A2K0U8B4_TRIHA|nr:hypothetical protein THARTR1_05228 [Trichoderma harzianum]